MLLGRSLVEHGLAVPKGVSWLSHEIRHLTRVLVSSGDRFYNDNGFSRAASLAYTTLLSLVPIMTLVFGFLASFKGLEAYLPGVRDFLFRQFVPSGGIAKEVLTFLEGRQVWESASIVVIPFLIVTSLLLINSVESVLNQIWQVYEPRTIPQRVAAYCAIVVITPIFAISMYYTAKFRVEPIFYNFVSRMIVLKSLYEFLVPFLFDFFAFCSLYYLVPKAPVFFSSALSGAFVSAALFHLAKGVFAVYVRDYSSYSYQLMYGTIAAIPIFLFWLYLAWTIVLFGAEVAYQAQYLPRGGRLVTRSLVSTGDGRFVIAVQALVIIARAFAKAGPLPSELDLCEYLGCSSIVLRPTVEALRRAGMITRADSRDMTLTLQRAPETIRVSEVWQALYPNTEAPLYTAEVMKSFGAFLLSGRDMSLAMMVESVTEENFGAEK